jgi:hypothetical protein
MPEDPLCSRRPPATSGPAHPGREELYFDIDDWFRDELPNPPFYEDGNSVGAVTWFEEATAMGILERLQPLRRILDRYGVENAAVASSDPGTVIYEDRFQVGVIPHQRWESSPMPEGVVLGPTTSGSKRHLGKRARVLA